MTLIDESPMDETLLREALHDATRELAAPVQRLTEQAAFRGGRLRRRRAVATAGAWCAAAVVAVLFGTVVAGGSTDGAGIATDPGSPTATASPTPDAGPPDGAARWTMMPATEMLAALDDHLLPDGMGVTDAVITNEDHAPGEPERVQKGWLQADLVVSGRTVGGINVILMSPQEPSSRYTCPGNLVSPDACTELTNGAGTTSGRQSVTTTGDVTVLEVVLRGPGDGLVYVAVSNSADDKWGRGSTLASDTVPLTLDEVTDIAIDDLWTDWRPPGASAG